MQCTRGLYQLKYLSLDAPIPFASWREAQLMIAGVEEGQTAVGIIDRLRATHGLPLFSSASAEEIRAQVLEERRRELWLQGNRLGDMLRLDLPFPTGISPGGNIYEDGTCISTTLQERFGNPNLS